ncbi:MAG: hypothetical protein GY749_06920 [Desulfobacteraceae bacterium]|nr:hypothetical protein [Desulfobacteraceae bacterium]
MFRISGGSQPNHSDLIHPGMWNYFSGILKAVTSQNSSFTISYATSNITKCSLNTNGKIIGNNGSDFYEFDPLTERTTYIGTPSVSAVGWSGSALAANGDVVFANSHSEAVVKVHPDNSISTVTVGGPGGRKWSAITPSPDGGLFLTPSVSNWIIRLSPDNTITWIDTGDHAWFKSNGAQLGCDGNVYAVPNDSPNVLKVLLTTDGFTHIGSGLGKYGNTIISSSGNIYAVPYTANNKLLKISASGVVTEFVPLTDTAWGAWEWGCFCMGADGKGYSTRNDSPSFLVFDPETEKVNTYSYGNAVFHDSLLYQDSIYAFNGTQVMKIKFSGCRCLPENLYYSAYLNNSGFRQA